MVVDTRINDPEIQKILDEANRGAAPSDSVDSPPVLSSPSRTVFPLAFGYLQNDGSWATTFEVRELTGRDEEALARITDLGRSVVTLIQRATVRLGDDPATAEGLDSLAAGDWDSIMVAIRVATFGSTIDFSPTCQSCRSKFEITIDLEKDIPIRTPNSEEQTWTVTTSRHTFELSRYTGATQRKVYENLSKGESSVAELNTAVLFDSIESIDGRPVLGIDAVRDLSIADRKTLLSSIQDRRVGPDLEGVTIKCPTCGNEQSFTLDAATLFR